MPTRAELKARAKEQLKGKYGILFAILVVFLAIVFAISGYAAIQSLTSAIASNAVSSVSDLSVNASSVVGFSIGSALGSSFVFSIIVMLFSAGVAVSLAMIFLGVTEGKKPEVADLFKGFGQIWKAIGLMFWMLLFLMLWSLLFVFPAIIKACSYSQCFYIMAKNPDITAKEALNESKKMMAGHKWEYFVLLLSFLGWGILTGLTMGVLIPFTFPYVQTTMANYHKAVSGNLKAASAKVTPAELKPQEPEKPKAEPEE